MMQALWSRTLAGLRPEPPADATPARPLPDDAALAALPDWAHRLASLTSPALADALLGPAAQIEDQATDASRRHNRLVKAVQLEALDALGDAGFEPLVLKGLGQAAQYYADPDSRGVSDLDLLLPADAVDGAIGFLVERGFRFVPARTASGFSAPSPNSMAPLIGPDGLCQIDFHTDVESGAAARALPTAAVTARAHRIAVSDREILVPAPEDALLIIAANLSRDKFGGEAVRKVIDAAALLTRTSVEWSALEARAEKGGLHRALRSLLLLLRLGDLSFGRDPRPYDGIAKGPWRRLCRRWLALDFPFDGYGPRLAEEVFLAAGPDQAAARFVRRVQVKLSGADGVPARWRHAVQP